MRKSTWTILDLIRWAEERFRQDGLSTPRLDAEVLLAEALEADRVFLYTHFDQPLQPGELARFRESIKRRLRREPMAYIVGHKEFWSILFEVNPDVLIPRPETEVLISESLRVWSAIGNPRKEFQILEIGTGSGAISISLAKEIPEASIVATDISEKALAVAEKNARRNGVREMIHFLPGDLFDPVPQGKTFDLIVTNPPYISSDHFSSLMPEVRDFEPRLALDGGEDGLDFYRRAVPRIGEFLRLGGWFLGEIGIGQAKGIKGIVGENTGLECIDFINDLAGIVRVLRARKQ